MNILNKKFITSLLGYRAYGIIDFTLFFHGILYGLPRLLNQ